MTEYTTIVVPRIPGTPMFDDEGRMTDIWQRFFMDFKRVLADPSGELTASRIVATNSDGIKVSVSDLTSWIAGVADRITVMDDGDGTVTVTIPDTPTLVGMILSSLTASRLMASGSNKSLISTALVSWVAGTAGQITITDDGDGSITISIPAPFRVPATGANYFSVEADGTPVLEGDATVWNDQQVVLGNVKFAGASDPTWTAYKGGLVLAFNKAQDNIVYFTAQLSHKYKLNSNLEFHIHTAHADGDAGNSKWNFTYSWADVGDDFPVETSDTTTVASPADADKHELNSFGNLTAGGGADVSSVLICSLQREGTHGDDTYDDDIYLVAMDFHFEMDTMGSRTVTSK